MTMPEAKLDDVQMANIARFAASDYVDELRKTVPVILDVVEQIAKRAAISPEGFADLVFHNRADWPQSLPAKAQAQLEIIAAIATTLGQPQTKPTELDIVATQNGMTMLGKWTDMILRDHLAEAYSQALAQHVEPVLEQARVAGKTDLQASDAVSYLAEHFNRQVESQAAEIPNCALIQQSQRLFAE